MASQPELEGSHLELCQRTHFPITPTFFYTFMLSRFTPYSALTLYQYLIVSFYEASSLGIVLVGVPNQRSYLAVSAIVLIYPTWFKFYACLFYIFLLLFLALLTLSWCPLLVLVCQINAAIRRYPQLFYFIQPMIRYFKLYPTRSIRNCFTLSNPWYGTLYFIQSDSNCHFRSRPTIRHQLSTTD